MPEYVPNTDEIRDDYAHMIAPHTTWGEDGFDAWLDRERTTARREGQAEAWDEAVASAYLHETEHFISIRHDPNPYRENGTDQ